MGIETNWEAKASTDMGTAARAQPAQLPAARGGEGPPPSNRGPTNSILPSRYASLRQGIDSLEMSFPGQLSAVWDAKLEALKGCAQSEDKGYQALAIARLGDHYFEVKPAGSGRFSYVLEDGTYRLRVSSYRAKQLPLAHCQIRSEWLFQQGPEAAVADLTNLVSKLGEIEGVPSVSRMDLCADFMGPIRLNDWDESHWVKRAEHLSRHQVKDDFTGWSIGLSADLSARLYDKTIQIGQIGYQSLKEAWLEAGWSEAFPVYRLEFQFRRNALVLHEARSLAELMPKLGALWRYATTEWLRLTLPNPQDKTRSRWPLHPCWAFLSDLDWPNTIEGVSKAVRKSRAPDLANAYQSLMSCLTTFMAIKGEDDPHKALGEFMEETKAHYDRLGSFSELLFEEQIYDRAALKARKFNLDFPGISERVEAVMREAIATAYRKASEGEV